MLVLCLVNVCRTVGIHIIHKLGHYLPFFLHFSWETKVYSLSVTFDKKKKKCIRWRTYVTYRFAIHTSDTTHCTQPYLFLLSQKVLVWRTIYCIAKNSVQRNSMKWDRGLKEYKLKRSFLGWFVGLFVLVQKILVLPWLPSRPNKKYLFPHRTLFQFICPHRPARWAGRRAGSTVS